MKRTICCLPSRRESLQYKQGKLKNNDISADGWALKRNARISLRSVRGFSFRASGKSPCGERRGWRLAFRSPWILGASLSPSEGLSGAASFSEVGMEAFRTALSQINTFMDVHGPSLPLPQVEGGRRTSKTPSSLEVGECSFLNDPP